VLSYLCRFQTILQLWPTMPLSCCQLHKREPARYMQSAESTHLDQMCVCVLCCTAAAVL
jgi:hypothetical protein